MVPRTAGTSDPRDLLLLDASEVVIAGRRLLAAGFRGVFAALECAIVRTVSTTIVQTETYRLSMVRSCYRYSVLRGLCSKPGGSLQCTEGYAGGDNPENSI